MYSTELNIRNAFWWNEETVITGMLARHMRAVLTNLSVLSRLCMNYLGPLHLLPRKNRSQQLMITWYLTFNILYTECTHCLHSLDLCIFRLVSLLMRVTLTIFLITEWSFCVIIILKRFPVSEKLNKIDSY